MEQDLKNNIRKKRYILILGIVFSLIILLCSTYAFFTYSKESKAFSLTSGEIEALFTERTNSIGFSNAYPISDNYAISNLDKLDYIDFTITSNIPSDSQAIQYEIFLTEDENNTLSNKYVKLYLTDDNNNVIKGPILYSSLNDTSFSSSSNGKVIYIDNNIGSFSQNYRLYIWLDSEYSQNDVSQTFSFNVNIYAYNANSTKISISKYKDKLLNDYSDYVIEEDGITYLSGSSDDIDFNYVWYSGKLWRVTSIDSNGTMKLITDDVITTISYNSSGNVAFYTDESTNSYMYQWLNQDFLSTLYNYENIIQTDASWYSLTTEDYTTKINSTVDGITTYKAPVGLLNSYEYYMSYKNTSYSSGYLNIGYFWWLLNPYNASRVWRVNDGGSGKYSTTPNANGSRPSINLKSNVSLTGGDGSKTNPYRIVGDKEEAEINTTLLNTRISGEYVNFDGELYRIVSIEENGIIKLNKNDYIRDTSSSAIPKKFASTETFGSTTNTQSDDYWDYYLNKTWYNSVSSEYQNMMIEGTYYLGQVNGSGVSYKKAICSTVSSTISINDCEKTTSTWTGLVGLPRYGEMFASQQGSGYSLSIYMWLITPYDTSDVWFVSSGGNGNSNDLSSTTHGSRPSINLKSTVKITGGTGLKDDPFEISL